MFSILRANSSRAVAPPLFDISDISPDAWYESSDTNNFSTTGNLVDQWDDISGNAIHLAGPSGFEPSINLDTVNSLNAVTFNGDALSYGSLPFSGTSGHVFVVFQRGPESGGPGGSDQVLVSGGSNSGFGNDYTLEFSVEIDTNKAGIEGLTDINAGDTVLVDDTTYLVHYKSDGSTYSIDVDGNGETISQVSGSNTGDMWGDVDHGTTSDNFGIGRRFGTAFGQIVSFKGLMCEIVIKDSTLSAGEVTSVTDVLKTKWGIT